MTREEIEAEIRNLLASETRTTVLSNKLFQQGTGLFLKLWSTQEEKLAVMQTELFKTSMERVRELQYRDADALRDARRVLCEKFPNADFRLTLDAQETPAAPTAS